MVHLQRRFILILGSVLVAGLLAGAVSLTPAYAHGPGEHMFRGQEYSGHYQYPGGMGYNGPAWQGAYGGQRLQQPVPEQGQIYVQPGYGPGYQPSPGYNPGPHHAESGWHTPGYGMGHH